jgi:hypothetical protein
VGNGSTWLSSTKIKKCFSLRLKRVYREEIMNKIKEFNRPLLACLSNRELVQHIAARGGASSPVANEIVKRFIAMVDNKVIDEDHNYKSIVCEPVRGDHENEIDDLRSAIREAIDVLESI